MQPLTRLRLQLTVWYGATFALILAVLGLLLLGAISGQLSAELDSSLRAATGEIARAAGTRELEAAVGAGRVVDALDELRIPDRDLYLFDITGSPIKSPAGAEVLRALALEAGRQGRAHGLIDLPDGRRLRVQAERFVLPSGHNFVAVATADRIELEKKYAALIALFAVAAFVSLLLVAGGGWFLARKATGPVERGVEHMRRFMAEAAHELRTPITILRSRADVALQRDRGAEAYVEALTQVRREAEQLSGIVDDLLTLARAEAGELALRLERVHLDEVALDAVAAAGALAERRQVQLNVGAAEEAEVHADAGLLRQLTMILLDNALKFTPAGGRVTLDVGAVNGEASLQVRDTGVGITPAELPRIFDRFYRGGEARRHASGAGLGLSIARWIVQAHGGRIVADSQPGSGTTISVTLPTIRSAAAH